MLHSGKQPIPLDAEIGHVHQEVLGVVDSTTQLNMLIMCHKVKSHKRRFLKNLIFFPKNTKIGFSSQDFLKPKLSNNKAFAVVVHDLVIQYIKISRPDLLIYFYLL